MTDQQSEHWTPNRRGMPAGGVLAADDMPVNGPRPRAPRWVIERWRAAAAAANFRSTAAWMVSRLQIAADLDLRGEE
jgi:hypothetical protein